MFILIFIGVFIALDNPFAGLVWCAVLIELYDHREKDESSSNK